MNPSRPLLWSSALLGSLLFVCGAAAGCSDDDADDDSNDDAGASSSSSSGGSSGASSSSGAPSGSSSSSGSTGTDAGTSIPIPDGATLSWSSKGGFAGPGGEDSVCQPSDDTYVYDLGTKSLTWKLCRPAPSPADAGTVYGYDQGTKTTDATEDAAIHAALAAVVTTSEISCGADAPVVTLDVIAPNDATTTYVDNFYHCTEDGKSYVDGLGELGSAFSAAATATQ